MAARLYETLEIQPYASPDEIRRAYKRRALQTHPDRLPVNVSPQEKAAAEEQFRLVNNAYEVLSDAEKRRVYDTHGVWPPPRPSPEQARQTHNGYSDPFFNVPFFSNSFFGSPSRGFPRQSFFTDPFVLFNSLFGDSLDLHFDNRGLHDSFDRDPFGTMPVALPFGFGSAPRNAMGGGYRDGRDSRMRSMVYQSSFLSDGQNSRWVSDRHMRRTVNGVTQSVRERRDSDGNVHVNVKHPDGRETYTINGIEQPARAIADALRHRSNESRKHHSRTSGHYDDPPPAYDAGYQNQSGDRLRR